MTPAELREAVGLAIAAADTVCDAAEWRRRVADAALRVVREAMRNSRQEITDAVKKTEGVEARMWAWQLWPVALAASPLRDE